MKQLSKFKGHIFSLSETVKRKRVAVYAAASDYYLFMSLVPILMLLVSLVRFLPLSQSDVMQTFEAILPASVYSVIDPIVSSIFRSGSVSTTVSILLTLFSASSSMRRIMLGLDEVYEVQRKDGTVIFFARACVYMLVFVVVVLLSLVVLVYGPQILELLRSYSPHAPIIRSFDLIGQVRYLVVVAFLTAFFLLMYRWLPAGKRKLSDQWPGALFCALAWGLFSWAFSLYISISNKFGAYGYIGTIMVAMMWMYYCLMFFLIGGCLNTYVAAGLSKRPRLTQTKTAMGANSLPS